MVAECEERFSGRSVLLEQGTVVGWGNVDLSVDEDWGCRAGRGHVCTAGTDLRVPSMFMIRVISFSLEGAEYWEGDEKLIFSEAFDLNISQVSS